jgi:hypothetical protein
MNTPPKRLDTKNPEDVQMLVNTGLAWRSGPTTLQAILQLIETGAVQRVPERETPEVAAYLDEAAPLAPPKSQPLEPGDVLPELPEEEPPLA